MLFYFLNIYHYRRAHALRIPCFLKLFDCSILKIGCQQIYHKLITYVFPWRPTTPLEPLNKEDERIESPQWLADPAESPEEFTERSELSRALQHCLDKLPMDFRTVIVLVDIHGLNYREASEAIGKPLGTVKSRLARSRIRMRDCLGGFGELLPPAYRLVGESE